MARFPARVLLAGLFMICASGAAVATTLPLDWHPGPSTVASQCDAAAQRFEARARAIADATAHHTFTNTILALEDAAADANDAVGANRALALLAPDPDVQAAAGECDRSFSRADAAVFADPALYRAVAQARAGATARAVYDRKLTALWFARLQRSGGALPERYRAEYLALSAKLNDVETRFARNAESAGDVVVVSRRALGDMPDSELASYTPQRGGAYRVPVADATLAFLTFTTDEDARRAYWYAYNDRSAAANLPLFNRAIAIRDRIAHLFGYETWTQYRVADRMAQSMPHVAGFIDTMTAALRPSTTAEIEAMRQTIAVERRDPEATLEPWDVAHAQYLLRKNGGDDPANVNQYFPAQHTLDAVLDVVQTVLGVRFARVDAPDTWAPDVIAYDVRDQVTNALLGTTYFDLAPRAHKRSGSTTLTVLPARTIDGQRRAPVAIVVAGWPAPARGRPALLSHDDVVALFRALGDDMATMLATAPYETLTNGFRDDFAAAPAQTFANFAWQPEILKRISAQWRTGVPMADDTIATLVATRSPLDAYDTMRQLVLARFDLDAHASGSRVDTDALFAHVSAALLPTLDAPSAHPQLALGALMSGDDANLYAGPWASRYADDLFTAFAGGSLLDPAVGMRYREDILAPARTYEPDIEVKRFLGRRMQPGAYFAELGLPCC